MDLISERNMLHKIDLDPILERNMLHDINLDPISERLPFKQH